MRVQQLELSRAQLQQQDDEIAALRKQVEQLQQAPGTDKTALQGLGEFAPTQALVNYLTTFLDRELRQSEQPSLARLTSTPPVDVAMADFLALHDQLNAVALSDTFDRDTAGQLVSTVLRSFLTFLLACLNAPEQAELPETLLPLVAKIAPVLAKYKQQYDQLSATTQTQLADILIKLLSTFFAEAVPRASGLLATISTVLLRRLELE